MPLTQNLNGKPLQFSRSNCCKDDSFLERLNSQRSKVHSLASGFSEDFSTSMLA